MAVKWSPIGPLPVTGPDLAAAPVAAESETTGPIGDEATLLLGVQARSPRSIKGQSLPDEPAGPGVKVSRIVNWPMTALALAARV